MYIVLIMIIIEQLHSTKVIPDIKYKKVNLLQVKEKRHKENNMGNIREQSPPFPPQGRVSGF